MSSLIADKIRSRGYWRVVVRPAVFRPHMKSFNELTGLVERCSVQLRGWDFPHVSAKAELIRGNDWVGQDSDWSGYVEVWRAYVSGQFVDLAGFFEDWKDENPLDGRVAPEWQPGQLLYIEHIIFRMTEIFEFASRWAMTEAGDAEMRVAIEAHGLKDRMLGVLDLRRLGFREMHVANIEEWQYHSTLSREELVSRSLEQAQQACADLLMRFGWEPSADVIDMN